MPEVRHCIECIECREVAEPDVEAHGWRAYLAQDPDARHEPPELVVYCPACAEREFGDG